MKTINQNEFDAICKNHNEWINDNKKGIKAIFENIIFSKEIKIENRNLKRAEFINCYIESNISLSDFSESKFLKCKIQNKYINGNFQLSLFSETKIIETTIVNSNFTYSEFKNSNLLTNEFNNIDFRFFKFKELEIKNNTYKKVIFNHGSITNGKIDNNIFRNCSFLGVIDESSDFIENTFSDLNTVFENTVFRNSNMIENKFYNLKFSAVDFSLMHKMKKCLFYACDLRNNNLSNIDTENCKFENTIGDGHKIKTIQTDVYHINIINNGKGKEIQIGCQNFLYDEWMQKTDNEIKMMDEGNTEILQWWQKWKPIIKLMIE